MSDYISIGNLAADLKTSKQKLGQGIMAYWAKERCEIIG